MIELDSRGRVLPNQVKLIISYNPETGVVKWKERSYAMFGDTGGTRGFNTRYAGEVVGCTDNRNRDYRYLLTRILGVRYCVHRLVYAYMTGEWPDQVDHINHDGSDNRWCNLRNVNQSENSRNMKRSEANKSGTTGLYWVESTRKWNVTIGNKSLGYYVDKDAAIRARKRAEHNRDYHKNHGVPD